MAQSETKGLHLLVPGLLGPFAASVDPLSAPRLQPLETLLARGRWHPCSGQTLTEAAIHLFAASGAAGEDLPVAALCRLSDGLADRELDWVCAAPVFLHADQHRVLLSDLPSRALSVEQAQRFADRLSAHFDDQGWEFEVAAPHRWYLGRRGAPSLDSAPLEAVIGRNIDLFLPGGRQGAQWRAMLNEIQMVLHSCCTAPFADGPENDIGVNGLWLWGGGALPAPPKRPTFAHVASADPLLRGLALWGGASVGEPGSSLGELVAATSGGAVLGVVDGPARPVLDVDPTRWGEALESLEQSLWRPLVSALLSGELEVVSLYPCNGRMIEVRRGDLYRVWKRRRRIEEWVARESRLPD